MMRGRKTRTAAILLVAAIIAGAIFRGPLATSAKVAIFVAQVFPQVPVKPLNWISRAPTHTRLTLSGPQGPIQADLFLPRPLVGSVRSEPAIIIAQGVKLTHSELKDFLDLGDTLARLGFVVLFPRLEALETGHAGLEEPATYIRSFNYLAHLPRVDSHRISFLGFSVGSSVALVAAADPRIRRKVHSLVFFAGYYNIFDYLVSLATREDVYHGRQVGWDPSTGRSGAVAQVRQVLVDKGSAGLLRLFNVRTSAQARSILATASPADIRALQRYNPATHRTDFRAPTFILDDTGDRFVPYVESEKLAEALPPHQLEGFLLSSAFQHVVPSPGGILHLVGALPAVFAFLYGVLGYL